MKKSAKFLSLFIILAFFSSCASIVSRSSWPLAINSTPSGAKVEITDREGVVVYSGNSPAIVSLKSGDGFFTKQSYRVKLSLNGYGERIIPVECTLNGWYAGNILFGGLIGILVVDPATGAMYKLDRKYINETLSQNISSTDKSLKIINIKDLPETVKEHLVCLK